LREPEKSKELIERHLETTIEPTRFEVSEIVIYESQLQKSGSIYSIVSKQKLREI
jgi:2'-5' RNA ligase